MTEAEYLKTKIKAFVADLAAEGVDKDSIGAAMVGYGAGLVHHHSPNLNAVTDLVSGILDAVYNDSHEAN